MELGMNHARLGSLLELGRIEGLVGVAAFKRLLPWLLKLQMCSTCHLVSSATTNVFKTQIMADKEFQLPCPSCRSKNQSLKNSYYSLTADNEDIARSGDILRDLL
jgi:hypothetical protein